MEVRITKFRARLGLALRRNRVSQSKLGAVLNPPVHRTTVARWMGGETLPTPYQLLEAADYLKVASRWLLGVSDEEAHPVWPTPDQRALLAAYERLNPEGRKAILAAVEDASESIVKAGAT